MRIEKNLPDLATSVAKRTGYLMPIMAPKTNRVEMGLAMFAMFIFLIIFEVFGFFNEFDPLLLIGVFVVGVAILGVWYLMSGGNPQSPTFFFIFSGMCILALYLFFVILFH